jgi:hypothetical protein
MPRLMKEDNAAADERRQRRGLRVLYELRGFFSAGSRPD